MGGVLYVFIHVHIILMQCIIIHTKYLTSKAAKQSTTELFKKFLTHDEVISIHEIDYHQINENNKITLVRSEMRK